MAEFFETRKVRVSLLLHLIVVLRRPPNWISHSITPYPRPRPVLFVWQVIQMDKPACTLLVDANACKAVLDRQRHQLKGIASGHRHIAGMAATMGSGFALAGLHRMRRVTVAGGYQHGSAVVRAQGLQSRHETGVHVQPARVLAPEFFGAEVGVVLPVHGLGSL